MSQGRGQRLDASVFMMKSFIQSSFFHFIYPTLSCLVYSIQTPSVLLFPGNNLQSLAAWGRGQSCRCRVRTGLTFLFGGLLPRSITKAFVPQRTVERTGSKAVLSSPFRWAYKVSKVFDAVLGHRKYSVNVSFHDYYFYFSCSLR